MRFYILFFSLIFGFQISYGMEMSQDELDQQLVDAVLSYYDRNQQATAAERVGDLLNRGANPNILMDGREKSPLLYLLIMGNLSENRPIKRRLMELLIRAGADPDCRAIEDSRLCSSNTTPLWWSCSVEDRAIFDLLVEYGADIRQLCNNNGTLLHSAAKCWNIELCEFLLREGLDVNAVDDDGNTPLHFLCDQFFARARATQNNGLAVIALLLDWGAQINLENNMGRSPLHLAIENNVASASVRPIVRALLARGADFNSFKFPLERAQYVHHRICKRYFKERRKLCELILTHQVLVNKGIITLLCSLRKLGLEGNDGARALYRYRGHLLTPYLQGLYIPLGELLREPDPFGLQMPLQRLLQGPNLHRLGKTYISGFRGFGANFPSNNFNIDFLDPERIPETYQNLNRNIYRGFQQPQVIALAESNPVLINNNNNEPIKEDRPARALALAQDDLDSYDDYSDDDNNDIWPMIRALNPDEVEYMPTKALRPGQTDDDIWPMMTLETFARRQRETQDAARQAERERVLGMHPSSPEVNSAKEQPVPKVPQLNSNNSNIPHVVLAIAVYGAVSYVLYKCYTNWKNKIEKEKRGKKKEGRNKKVAPLVASAAEVQYA